MAKLWARGFRAGALAREGGETATVDLDTLEHENPRLVGCERLCLAALDELDFAAILHRLGIKGRYSGWIASHAGIAGEADLVLIPEVPVSLAAVITWAKSLKECGREYAILVVAEGALINDDKGKPLARGEMTAVGYEKLGGVSVRLAEALLGAGVNSRTTILGHIQRGGTPTAFDRMLALRYGARAVDILAEGITGVMVGLRNDRMTTVPLAEVAGQRRNVDPSRAVILGVPSAVWPKDGD